MQQELVELKLKRDHARAKLGECVVMWGWSEEGGRVMVWGVVEECIRQVVVLHQTVPYPLSSPQT